MIETLKDIYNDIYQNEKKVTEELEKAFDTDDINHLTDDIYSICENHEYVQELISNINNMNCYYYDYHLEETVKVKTIIDYSMKSINNHIQHINYEYNELNVYELKITLKVIENEINDFIQQLEDMNLCIEIIEEISSKFREKIRNYSQMVYNNKVLQSLLLHKNTDVILSLIYASNIENEVECKLEWINETKNIIAICQDDIVLIEFNLNNDVIVDDDFINEFNEVMNDY